MLPCMPLVLIAPADAQLVDTPLYARAATLQGRGCCKKCCKGSHTRLRFSVHISYGFGSLKSNADPATSLALQTCPDLYNSVQGARGGQSSLDRNCSEVMSSHRSTRRGAMGAPQRSMTCQSWGRIWRLPCGPACQTPKPACPHQDCSCSRSCHLCTCQSAASAQKPLQPTIAASQHNASLNAYNNEGQTLPKVGLDFGDRRYA